MFFPIKFPDKCIQDAIQYFNIYMSFYMKMYYSIKVQCSVFILDYAFYLVKTKKNV